MKLKDSFKETPVLEKIATLTFVIFLIWVFIYAWLIPFNEDITLIRESGLIIDYGFMSHASPLFGVLFYKLIPTKLIIWLSPFAIVGIYLLLYFLVSKKIIYWYPITIIIPPFFSTLIPSVIDWLLLPIIYHKLITDHEKQGIALSAVMIYFHGPFALMYLPILFFYLRKIREFFWVVIFSLPQLIPLLYFSKGYTTYISKYLLYFSVYGFFDFTTSYFNFRILITFIYSLVFLVLMIDNQKKISK
jgi:hypothetical protein